MNKLIGLLIVILAIVLTTACGGPVPHPRITYQLSTGKKVTCTHADYGYDSVNLSGCDDGNTYLRQSNVIKYPIVTKIALAEATPEPSPSPDDEEPETDVASKDIK